MRVMRQILQRKARPARYSDAPQVFSERQRRVSMAGRMALDALPGTCCADAWTAIQAGPQRGARRARQLPETGAGLSALTRYGALLRATRGDDGAMVSSAFRCLLAHPLRTTRGVLAHAEMRHSPHAEALARNAAPTFAHLVLILKTMRDRPDLLCR